MHWTTNEVTHFTILAIKTEPYLKENSKKNQRKKANLKAKKIFTDASAIFT